MDFNFDNDFYVMFENNSTSNYLLIRPKDSSLLLDYQVQMLLNNKIGGLLDFNINNISGEFNCFYNVTSRCSLLSFLSRKKFKRNEFLLMLLNIINNVIRLNEYLLYDFNILLDERYIYLDPEKQDLAFVYLPFSGVRNNYKNFFLDLLISKVNFNEENTDNFTQKLLEILRNDFFNLTAFKNQLELLLGNQFMSQSESSSDIVLPDESKKSPSTLIKNDDNIEKIACKKTGILNVKIPVPEKKSIAKNSKCVNSVVFQGKTPSDIQLSSKNHQARTHKMNLPALFFILLQPVLLIIYIITVSSGFIDAGQNRMFTAIIALVIFVCIDILIFRLMGEKLKNVKNKPGAGAAGFITAKMKEGFSPLADKDSKAIIAEQVKIKSQISGVQTLYHGETEVIKRPVLKGACLKATDGSSIIEINKKSFLLGRMESLVDSVISGSAIGRIHSEVIKEGDDFYIVDCNSKNGTFVNDKRLTPNTKQIVFNNDLVRFANKEFRFLV